jgi:chloramphenicol 3-O phosphotransferase
MAAAVMVYLNGPSSVGKTTLARAIQEAMDEPYLHAGTDHFLPMLPNRYWGHEDGFRFVFSENGEPLELTAGPVAHRLIAGMVSAITAVVNSGNNVVVETGFWGDELRICIDGWAHLIPLFVGVNCPAEVLEKRESERGDRLRGLARLQAGRIPAHGIYDLELDTSLLSAAECAEAIKTRLYQGPAPTALQRLRNSPVFAASLAG